jgi:FG-GAP repeat
MKRKNCACAAFGALLFFSGRVVAALPYDAFVETQTITAPNAAPFEDFGGAIVVSNDLLISGAINSLNNSGLETGGAYIYRRSATGSWNQTAKLLPNDGARNDEFGYSIGIDGDFAVVGAPTHVNGSTSDGAAYVFHRATDSSWQQIGEFPGPTGSTHLGLNAALDGSVAAVAGLRFVAPGAGTSRAFVDIYRQSGPLSWQQAQELVIGNQFSSVNGISIDNGTLVLGASRKATVNVPSTYEVEIFKDSTAGFVAATTLPAPVSPQDSWFGFSVSLDQDRLLISAPKEATHGAAYIYERNANGIWNQTAHLVLSDIDQRFLVGTEVSLHGDTAIVNSWSSSSCICDGRVYVFQLDPSGNWNEIATPTSPLSQGTFGYALAALDGQVLISSGLNAPGAIHVFSEIPEPATTPSITMLVLGLANVRSRRKSVVSRFP